MARHSARVTSSDTPASCATCRLVNSGAEPKTNSTKSSNDPAGRSADTCCAAGSLTLATAFFATAFLAAAFLGGAFFATAFLAAAFLATAVLAGAFFAATFFAGPSPQTSSPQEPWLQAAVLGRV